jgi:hypothetical protein
VCGHTGKKRKRRKGKTKNICFYFSFCLLSNDLPVHPTTTFLVARFPTPPVAVATTATTPGGGSTEQTNRNNNNNKQTNKHKQTRHAIFAVFPHGYATPRPTQWLRLVVVANMLAYSA